MPAELEEALGWLSPLRVLVERLVNELGYTRGVDLFGAPFDFRRSPLSNPHWADAMAKLVEVSQSVSQSDPQPSHSDSESVRESGSQSIYPLLESCDTTIVASQTRAP